MPGGVLPSETSLNISSYDNLEDVVVLAVSSGDLIELLGAGCS